MKANFGVYLCMIGLISMCLVGVNVDAMDSGAAFNSAFFDGAIVAPDARILTLYIEAGSAAEESGEANLILYETPNGPQEKVCDLTFATEPPFQLRCGAKVVYASYADGGPRQFQFLLRKKQDNWYQIILDPKSGSSAWLKDRKIPGIGLSDSDLEKWMTEGDSFRLAHDLPAPIPILESPIDSSKVLTDCGSFGGDDREGLIPEKDRINGDWIQVSCVENGCYSSAIPGLGCDMGAEEERKKQPRCAVGWVRWRSQDGHLRLYPNVGYVGGC